MRNRSGWRSSLAVGGLLCLNWTAAALAQGPVLLGDEFRVSAYTTSEQRFPAVASDADGDFVVVWQSLGQDADSYGVFGQRYASSGAAQGAEFRVNTYTTSNQYRPAVASDAEGDFLVVWESRDQDGSVGGVFGQRYSSSGAAQGAEFQVHSHTSDYQGFPSVASDAEGDFVVVWHSRGQDGSLEGVFGQRYSSSGAAQGAEFRVNTHTIGFQGVPAVASDAEGDFVVVWHSRGQDGSADGVFGQRYSSAGAAQGEEFRVNTHTPDYQRQASVASDADGDFVVVWESHPHQDGDNDGVFGQRYSSDGAAQGEEFQVNSYTTQFQRFPAVASDVDGQGFVVVWQSFPQDGDGYGIFARRYSSSGVEESDELQVNTYTSSFQGNASVAIQPGGNFAVLWASRDQDGSSHGVFGQRLGPQPPTATVTPTAAASATATPTASSTATATASASPSPVAVAAQGSGPRSGWLALFGIVALFGLRRKRSA